MRRDHGDLDRSLAALADDLAALSRSLPVPDAGARLSVAVMERVAELPAPVAPRRPVMVWRSLVEAVLRRRRQVAAGAVAVLLTLVAVPPVRATVVDWFGFAGVKVNLGGETGPSEAPDPPVVEGGGSLEQARRHVGFELVVPAALGPPDGVEVSADNRVVSMSWTGGPDGVVRLDQFDGRMDYRFVKTVPDVEFVTVDGGFAVWFDRPHEVVGLGRDGQPLDEPPRLAGHTLIWERGEVAPALRLEGDLTRDRAVEIAESVPSE